MLSNENDDLLVLFSQEQVESFNRSLRKVLDMVAKDPYVIQLLYDPKTVFFVPDRIQEIMMRIMSEDRRFFIQNIIDSAKNHFLELNNDKFREMESFAGRLLEMMNKQIIIEAKQRGSIKSLREQLHSTQEHLFNRSNTVDISIKKDGSIGNIEFLKSPVADLVLYIKKSRKIIENEVLSFPVYFRKASESFSSMILQFQKEMAAKESFVHDITLENASLKVNVQQMNVSLSIMKKKLVKVLKRLDRSRSHKFFECQTTQTECESKVDETQYSSIIPKNYMESTHDELKKKDEEIARLQNQICSLKIENDKEKASFQQSQLSVQEYIQTIEEKTREYDVAMKWGSSLSNQMNEYSGIISSLQQDIERYRRDSLIARSTLADEIEIIQNKHDEVIKSLKTEIFDLNIHLNEKDDKIIELSKINETLNGKIADKEKIIRNLNDSIKKFVSNGGKLSKSYDESDGIMYRSKSENIFSNEPNFFVSKPVPTLLLEFDEYVSSFSSRIENRQLTTFSKSFHTFFSELNGSNTELIKENHDLLLRIASAEGEVKTLSSLNEAKTSQIKRVSEENVSLSNQILENNFLIQKMLHHEKSSEETIKNLHKELLESNKRAESLSNTIKLMKFDSDKISLQIDQISKQTEKTNKNHQSLISHLNMEISQEKKSLYEIIEEKGKLITINNQITQELERTNMKLSYFEQMIERMKIEQRENEQSMLSMIKKLKDTNLSKDCFMNEFVEKIRRNYGLADIESVFEFIDRLKSQCGENLKILNEICEKISVNDISTLPEIINRIVTEKHELNEMARSLLLEFGINDFQEIIPSVISRRYHIQEQDSYINQIEKAAGRSDIIQYIHFIQEEFSSLKKERIALCTLLESKEENLIERANNHSILRQIIYAEMGCETIDESISAFEDIIIEKNRLFTLVSQLIKTMNLSNESDLNVRIIELTRESEYLKGLIENIEKVMQIHRSSPKKTHLFSKIQKMVTNHSKMKTILTSIMEMMNSRNSFDCLPDLIFNIIKKKTDLEVEFENCMSLFEGNDLSLLNNVSSVIHNNENTQLKLQELANIIPVEFKGNIFDALPLLIKEYLDSQTILNESQRLLSDDLGVTMVEKIRTLKCVHSEFKDVMLSLSSYNGNLSSRIKQVIDEKTQMQNITEHLYSEIGNSNIVESIVKMKAQLIEELDEKAKISRMFMINSVSFLVDMQEIKKKFDMYMGTLEVIAHQLSISNESWISNTKIILDSLSKLVELSQKQKSSIESIVVRARQLGCKEQSLADNCDFLIEIGIQNDRNERLALMNEELMSLKSLYEKERSLWEKQRNSMKQKTNELRNQIVNLQEKNSLTESELLEIQHKGTLLQRENDYAIQKEKRVRTELIRLVTKQVFDEQYLKDNLSNQEYQSIKNL